MMTTTGNGTQAMPDLFVLVHSPLVGSLTWSLVASALRERGNSAVVPLLHDSEGSGDSYWAQHVASVTEALASVPPEQPVVLVGHSGAGPLLPALGRAIPHRITAYLFVDAGLPLDGRSHLSDMAASVPELARQLRTHLAGGGRFPEWREEDLRTIVPDPAMRRRLVADLQPRDLTFFEEPIPGFASGPHAPCAYLQFSAPYEGAAARARQEGWPFRAIAAGHFHMLVEPEEVAAALVDLARAARQQRENAP
jgi:pimeloyl-ACP methyl ester carboxylesterase